MTRVLIIIYCFMLLLVIDSNSMTCYCKEAEDIEICGYKAEAEKNEAPGFNVSFSENATRGEVDKIAASANGMTAVAFKHNKINIYNEKAEYMYTAEPGISHSSYGLIWIDEKLYIFVKSNTRSDFVILSNDRSTEYYDLNKRDCQLIINELEKQNTSCENPKHTTYISNNRVIRTYSDGSEIVIYHDRIVDTMLWIERLIEVIAVIAMFVLTYKLLKKKKRDWSIGS